MKKIIDLTLGTLYMLPQFVYEIIQIIFIIHFNIGQLLFKDNWYIKLRLKVGKKVAERIRKKQYGI